MEYVLVVYSLPGAAVKRIVLVQVIKDHRDTLLRFQSKLASFKLVISLVALRAAAVARQAVVALHRQTAALQQEIHPM